MTMLRGAEIVTTAQMRAIESAAMGSGLVSGLNLMTRAGRAVADQARLTWPAGRRVTVLCGPGNNGGDGHVAARLLREAGWQVHLLADPSRPGSDAASARAGWAGPVGPLTAEALQAAPPPDLVIDAMLGAGLARPPDPAIAAILAWLAAHPQFPVLAVDGPSGLDLDSGTLPDRERGRIPDGMYRAALSVTFHALRPGHLLELGPTLCGRVVVADIGLPRPSGPPRMLSLHPLPHDDPAEGQWLRKHQGHKFTHGAALVVAGPSGQGGAARLAARAALRAGAGLVTIAAPQAAMGDHSGPPDALMRRPVDDVGDLAALLGDRRPLALCLGPGCGVARAALMLSALDAHPRPCVLDADALTALARDPRPLPPETLLTPHAGEFARLFPDLAGALQAPCQGGRGKPAILRQAAARIGAVVLLKGPDSVIAHPDGRVAIHSDPHLPWLATAGAGDVLAGIATGLLARGLPAFEAACLAVRLHAASARRFGPGLIADDLIDTLPCVIARWPLEAAAAPG